MQGIGNEHRPVSIQLFSESEWKERATIVLSKQEDVQEGRKDPCPPREGTRKTRETSSQLTDSK